jgi:hypothetical protein
LRKSLTKNDEITTAPSAIIVPKTTGMLMSIVFHASLMKLDPRSLDCLNPALTPGIGAPITFAALVAIFPLVGIADNAKTRNWGYARKLQVVMSTQPEGYRQYRTLQFVSLAGGGWKSTRTPRTPERSRLLAQC